MERQIEALVGGREAGDVLWLSLDAGEGAEERFREARGLDSPFLRKLVSLSLRGHALGSVDAGFRGLQQLQELDLSKNRLKRLDGIGHLRQLRVLNVGGNMIEALPEQLGLLQELQWMDLSKNRISSATYLENLEPCEKLFRLCLEGNPVTKMPNLEKILKRSCPGLIMLDGNEIESVSKTRAGHSFIDRATLKELEEKAARAERQLASTSTEMARFRDEKGSLIAELEATRQLLARKTSEWAVAEEKVARLEREVGFAKIDGKLIEEHEKDSKVEKLVLEDSPSEPKRWGLVSKSPNPETAVLAGHEDSKMALVTVENEISSNAKDATSKFKIFNEKLENAKRELAESQAELDAALKAREISDELSTMANPIESKPHQLQNLKIEVEKKEKELEDMKNVHSCLKELRDALRRKEVALQDLISARALLLCTADSEMEEARCDIDVKQRRLDELSLEVASTSTKMYRAVTAHDHLRKRFPDIVELGELETEIENEELFRHNSGLDSESNDAMVEILQRKLPEQLHRCCGYLRSIEGSVRHCERQEDHVMKEIAELKQEPQEVESPVAAVVTEKHSTDREGRRIFIETLRAHVRDAKNRVRDCYAEIMQLKCEAWRTEAMLRTKQCQVMFSVVEQKESAIKACNQTIERLKSPNSPETSSLGENALGPALSIHTSPPRVHATSSETSEMQAPASVMLDEISEQKARSLRRQVFDELVESEKVFVGKLDRLLQEFLVPMRRRCLLPPKDLQIVCLNFEQIFRLHEGLDRAISSTADAPIVIDAFEKRLKNFEMYEVYAKHLSASLAIICLRRQDTMSFAKIFLGDSQRLETIRDLMFAPLRRLQEYEKYFHRLTSLNTASASAQTQKRLSLLLSWFTRLLNSVETKEERILCHQSTLEALFSVLSPHTIMDNKHIAWIEDATQEEDSQKCRRFVQEVECIEAQIVLPNQKSSRIGHGVLVCFNDCFILATNGSSRWVPTFPDERPRRRALHVFRAADDLSCSDIFEEERDEEPTSSGSPKIRIGLRIACNEFCCKTKEDQDKFVELDVNFPDEQKASVFRRIVQGMVQNFETDPEVQERAKREERKLNKVQSMRSVRSLADVDLGNDDLAFKAKHPGIDMKKRREIARKLREERKMWKPPELENINSTAAAERIRKRDGMPLVSGQQRRIPGSQPLLRTQSRLSTGPATPNRLKPQALFTTPGKQTIDKKEIGFGSAVPSMAKSPKSRSACVRRQRGDPQDESEVEGIQNRQANLSIFKAPMHQFFRRSPKSSDSTSESDPRFGERFIGIPHKSSEQLKERIRNEKRYYH